MKHLLYLLLFFNLACNFSEKRKKTLILGLESEISSLDPVNAFDDSSLKAINQSYETLYEYHYLKRNYKLEPLLAEDFPQVNADRTIYTIRIKKNIPYHPHAVFQNKKRYVMAQDFINQIKRLAFSPLEGQGRWLFKGKLKGFDEFTELTKLNPEKFYEHNISGLTAPDEHTLRLELKEPIPELFYLLAMSFVVPIPEEILRFYNNDLSKNIIGTGPFVFESLHKEGSFQTLTLNKFSPYRGTFYPTLGDRYAHEHDLLSKESSKVKTIDILKMVMIEDEKTRWENFMSKKIDVIEIPKQFINEAIDLTGDLKNKYKKKDILLQFFPSHSSRWLAFNMNDPLLGKNLFLRKAICHAIDYKKYLRDITDKTGQKANSIYIPGVEGYDPAKKHPCIFDLALANQFLTLAGFAQGKNLPVIKYATRGKSDRSQQEAAFIKESLEKINIKINVQEANWKEFIELARQHKLQFWTDGWILDYPEAKNILQLLLSKNIPSGLNKTSYSNLKLDSLYDDLTKTTDKKKSKEIMESIENLVDQDLPWIMLYYNHTYMIYHQRVKNFRQSNFIRNFLKYIELE